MASTFLSGQREELGSGGKVIRGRRRLIPSFSPYSRPPSSAVLIPHQGSEAHTGRSLSWLMGLISGVGKLFSSVIGSDSSPSPSECFSNSDEYHDYSSNEHEDQLCSDDFTVLRMRESEVDRNVESLDIFPKSETKLVIEQLLMQETFTRDECNKLVEIIQSRVPDRNYVEIDEGTRNAVPMRVTEQGRSLNHYRSIYGISNFSPRIPSSFSPRFYAQETVFSDLRDKAVMEAKKWVEEKKVSPTPTYDRSHGPCILSTRMNQYGFEEDVGSPIEMAKSYMQSLPPWRSPSFSANGLKTSPSRGNSTCNLGSHLLSTSEVKKRDYFSVGSYNTEENHRTYLNLLNNEQEFSTLGQSKLLSRFSVHEASTIPSSDAKTCIEVQDKCLKLQDGNAAAADQLMETDNDVSVGAILQPQEIVEAPLPIEEQIGSISAPQDSLVFASIPDRNNGDSFPETETLQFENITPAEPSINRNSGDEVKFSASNSMQVDIDAAFNNTNPITDLELRDEDPQTHEEANGSGEKIETSSNFADINSMKPDFDSTSKGDPTATSSSYGGAPAASVSEGTSLEPASDISVGIRRSRANRNAKKARSTNMKSVEPMLTEPPEPSRGNTPKAKKVVKQKKWRG